jgi:hypothetical protein
MDDFGIRAFAGRLAPRLSHYHGVMSEPLSFDRDAWLYPYYVALKRFDRLARVLQAKALADAVQADHPAKATEIRDWNHATAIAMLTWLDTVMRTRPRHRESKLWRMRKNDREYRCVAVYLPTGIDVRFQGDEMRRTRLVPDKWLAQRLSAKWATQLRDAWWSAVNT